ncbi:methionine adenosyltransferase [Burkholderia ubonensis]|nr:methionine adenosyltransferase [Burkholderia ubonensis]RQP27758.1 methionine adenosyltransferase [Burkholderia ubonensis]RQP29774.1 methionine adenosyltransferase [Burkholderia ubonensis]RQP31930.1 methionine adenosyltransferase [Burkholderia ubonensis]RQP47873.1 methionine adenosyltransferase [Burkholderia ubonensis]RQP50890.1 methionine adenosyltransferase [Burkholderia ubonensis]
MVSTANIVVSVDRTVERYAPVAEMCEHKGVGHPDSMCDGAVEAAARALGRAYLDSYGAVQHFNIDKALLVGGTSEPKFGGGRVTQNMRFIVAGPVTALESGLPEAVVRQAIIDYLTGPLKLDADLVEVIPMLRASAPNLQRVNYRNVVPLANDTSFGVGYAPLSRLERCVLNVAEALRSQEMRDAFPSIGLDFKVMGHRVGGHMHVTLALAFVDSRVRDPADYFARKAAVESAIAMRVGDVCGLRCNTLDDRSARDEKGLYLTVTGFSAEQGDDGEVGRGNRVNGLITPGRPMSLEAVAGKNPAAHVGKLYNVLARQLAECVLADTVGAVHVTVRLLSAIGCRIDEPQLAAVDVGAPDGLSDTQCRRIQERVAYELHRLPALTRKLIDGAVRIC